MRLNKKTLAIATVAVLFVAGGSAAVLQSFGTVSGDTTVDQAVVVGETAVNNENDEDAFSQDYTFTAADVPTQLSDTVKVENNRDQETAVTFTTSRTVPGDTSDGNVEEGGFDTGYMLLHNGQLYSEGSATAEPAYLDDKDQTAVHAYGELGASDDISSAGVTFDVDATFDGDNTIKVDYEEGDDHPSDRQKPDWIAYRLDVDEDTANDLGGDYDEGTYKVIDPTVDADKNEEISWSSGDDRFTYSSGDDNPYKALVYDVDNEEWVDVSPSELEGNQITDIVVATGTATDDNHGSGTDFDLYYTGVSFNGENLLETFGTEDAEVELPSGESELKVFSDLAINAYPGTYGVTTNVVPPSEVAN